MQFMLLLSSVELVTDILSVFCWGPKAACINVNTNGKAKLKQMHQVKGNRSAGTDWTSKSKEQGPGV